MEPASRYTTSTIAFLKELPQHIEDPDWHVENKKRYEQVLRDPTRELVEQIRTGFIEQLSPEVAGGKRHLSILKKNDYSSSAVPWSGSTESLGRDSDALRDFAARGLLQVDSIGDRVRVAGADRVGLLLLPSGRRVLIRSKVPSLVILEWLSFLDEFPPLEIWLPDPAATTGADLYGTITRLFLRELEIVTRRFLRKDFTPVKRRSSAAMRSGSIQLNFRWPRGRERAWRRYGPSANVTSGANHKPCLTDPTSAIWAKLVKFHPIRRFRLHGLVPRFGCAVQDLVADAFRTYLPDRAAFANWNSPQAKLASLRKGAFDQAGLHLRQRLLHFAEVVVLDDRPAKVRLCILLVELSHLDCDRCGDSCRNCASLVPAYIPRNCVRENEKSV